MFFILTNLALDVTLGGGFWILKNTTYGVYNLYLYLMNNKQKYDANDIDESDIRKLYTEQQLKIDELNNNIKKLTNIVESKNKSSMDV